MRKYLPIIALITILIPSVTFAVWWNPFSWFKKKPIAQPVVQQVENKLENENVSPQVKSKSDNTKSITKESNADVMGSWVHTYPGVFGTVTIPEYKDRITRVNAICDYIEGPMRLYYPEAMSKQGYCSFVGPNLEPSLSYDVRSLLKSSKSDVEKGWAYVLAFEILKRNVLDDYIRKMQNLESVSIINTKTRTDNDYELSLNCSNYAIEKSNLSNNQSRSNNIDSSYGAKQRADLEQKYADCF